MAGAGDRLGASSQARPESVQKFGGRRAWGETGASRALATKPNRAGVESSGIYFYRLHAGDYVETRRMAVVGR